MIKAETDVYSPRHPATEPIVSPRAGAFLSGLANNFGAKDIGMFAGIVLLINNITGPGVPGLPNQFAEAGWLPVTVCILVVWFMTTVSASMYAEAMANIPGNDQFQMRIEYSTIVKYYFGRNWYIASQVGLNGALQSLNIISVVQSAQVMDAAISAIFGKSCGLNLTPFQNEWTADNITSPIGPSTEFFSCFDTTDLSEGHAWGCHVILTFGFIVTAGMAIPCGIYNLDDNMIIQQVAFVLTVLCWLIWCIAIASSADQAAGVPAVNSDPNTGSIAGVLGTILFNFGFVTTVPSWINEKKPEVRVNTSLWSSTTICIIVYALIGIPGAYVFSNFLQGPVSGTCPEQVYMQSIGKDFNCPNDLMQLLTQSQTAPWQDSGVGTAILKTSVYLFPIVAVVSSIPVFSIVIKYNLVENGFSNTAGFMWGVVFPWVTAFPLLYMPNVLAQFVNFTSLIFVSFTDFIVPFSLYFVLQRRQQAKLSPQDMRLPNTDRINLNVDALLGDGLLEQDQENADTASEHAEWFEDNPLSDAAGLASPALSSEGQGRMLVGANAFPVSMKEKYDFKKGISVVLGIGLTTLSCIAIYLTIQQSIAGDSYVLNANTCAHVGS